ncbi:MAG: radical SAM protein [Odoribacteraceae bacterium]|jgi:DNA repair photolyase|nr:radical SAM protein [Odoribacteraceae bacterium]
MKLEPAKTILQKSAHGERWFGIDYNMNLYRGCPHGCIYCDSRSACYRVDNFDTVRGKRDALAILERELRARRQPGIVGLGAMSDTYNPFEERHGITRKALELLDARGFGVSLETKSDLITRDADILAGMRAGVILKFTVTTADDDLAKIIEPRASLSSARFRAMKTLSDAGLFTGTLLTPILPFITDTAGNIRQIIRLSRENGARFIWSMGGVTLRDNQRDYFYNQLDSHFPGLRARYVSTFGNRYFCRAPDRRLATIFKEECEHNGLLYKMPDIIRAYKRPPSLPAQGEIPFEY